MDLRELPQHDIGNLTLGKACLCHVETESCKCRFQNHPSLTLHIETCEHCRNGLKNLLMELGQLSQLKVLRLKYNLLEVLPAVIAQFPLLEVLELADNRISVLDDTVLSKLHHVRQAIRRLLFLRILHRNS